jgi:hypothetical protein
MGAIQSSKGGAFNPGDSFNLGYRWFCPVDAGILVADAPGRLGKIKNLDPMSNRAVAEYLSVLDYVAFYGATPVRTIYDGPRGSSSDSSTNEVDGQYLASKRAGGGNDVERPAF